MLFLVLWRSCAPAFSQTRHDSTRRCLIGAWTIERKEAYELILHLCKSLFCHLLLYIPEPIVNISCQQHCFVSIHTFEPSPPLLNFDSFSSLSFTIFFH
ncbi:hypothetical protein HDV63DRAFT_373731 [Trichoderma sp. SZMC 28014]